MSLFRCPLAPKVLHYASKMKNDGAPGGRPGTMTEAPEIGSCVCSCRALQRSLPFNVSSSFFKFYQR